MRTLQVRDKIKAGIIGKMKSLSDKMSAGRAVDYAGYRQMVGHMQGLNDALESVDEVFKKLLDEQDD
jgi:hypothetical protein